MNTSKGLLLIIFLIGFTLAASAQESDTTMVEQYASINVYPSAFSNKVKIEQDFGDVMSIYKNNILKNEFGKARKFNTTIDALNYMGATGWSLVSTLPATSSTAYVTYVFKRKFKKSDLEEKQ